jgi:hypothetical protein
VDSAIVDMAQPESCAPAMASASSATATGSSETDVASAAHAKKLDEELLQAIFVAIDDIDMAAGHVVYAKNERRSFPLFTYDFSLCSAETFRNVARLPSARCS